MTADNNAKTITIRIDDENPAHVADNSLVDFEKKLFMIILPRNVINSTGTQNVCPSCVVGQYDVMYHVTITSIANNGTAVPFSSHINGESGTNNTGLREVDTEYPYGKSVIVIRGTSMIPEFGLAASSMIMTIGMAGAIGLFIVAVSRYGPKK
jgi:hypothetical protein